MEDSLAEPIHQKAEHDVNLGSKNFGRKDSRFSYGEGHNMKNFRVHYESYAPLITTPSRIYKEVY